MPRRATLDAVLPPATPAEVCQRWEDPPSGLAVPLGLGTAGPVLVDLAGQGPHALVGGTTGSGKSELLRSWVALLAATHPPDELNLVLIDYKGGAAFRECSALPHTVGLVTDLDAGAAARALRGLRAELTRREHQLTELGARDRDEAVTMDRTAACRLPRLVILVDELKALVEDLPEMVPGLVRIAALGRSLGVHVVLATQRPAGVITPEIRANTALRVALRVRDAADSRDVLDRPDAAALSASTPGRFLVATGGEAPALAQGVWASAPAPDGPGTVVNVRPAGAPAPAAEGSRTQLTALVETLVAAARASGRQPGPSPWPPPLPEHLVARPETGPPFVLGVQDGAAGQDLEPLLWTPSEQPHLAVVGAARSGRSSALALVGQRAMAAQWAVHALDATGALANLLVPEHDGRVGTLLVRDQAELVSRLLEKLLEQASTGPGTLLLVDDWPAWAGDLELRERGRPVDLLLRALREGPAQGLHAVVSGDRGLLTGRLAALLPARLGLRQVDPGDWTLLQIPAAQAPGALPPGRVLRPGGTLGQLCLPLPPATHTRGLAFRLHPLPALVPDVPEGCVGVGGDEASPLTVLPTTGEVLLAVIGGRGSGRSTALASIAARSGRPVIGLVPGTAPPPCWEQVPWETVVIRGDARQLTAAITARPDAVVIVDDLERLIGTETEEVLLARLHHARENAAGGVVAAGLAAELGATWRGLAAEMRRERHGIILSPASPADGELFGMRPDPLDRRTPGRGLLVRGGDIVMIQLALPPRA